MTSTVPVLLITGTVYQAHGATHLVLAHVVERRAELERYRDAVPGESSTR